MAAPPSFDSFPTARKAVSVSLPAPPVERERKRRRKDEHVSKSKRVAHATPLPRTTDYRDLVISTKHAFPLRGKPSSTEPIVLDLRGDAQNATLGGLYAGDVSRFYRLNAGRVLGLHPSLRIIAAHKRKLKDLIVLPRNQHTLVRYLDKRYSWKLLQNDVKLLELLPKTESKPPTDFESLLPEDLPQVAREGANDGHPDYRRIDEAGSSSDSSEDDLADDSTDKNARSYLDRLSKKNVELSSYCADHPRDTEGWLRFMRFQDERHAASSSLASREEHRTIVETKLAILDKALASNRNATVLVRERLRVGQAIWPFDQMEREWRKAMKRSAEDGESLALDWLAWKASDGRAFKFRSGFLRAAEEVFAAASNEDKLIVLAMVADMMSSAGYTERAFALYQAAVEFSCCMPANVREAALGDQLDEFELFWDGEAARFGEEAALGWASSDLDAPALSAPVSNPTDALVQAEPKTNGFDMWLGRELQEADNKLYPARLGDSEEDDEDVFRVVLSNDVRPFLFAAADRTTLIYDCLDFFGCHIVPPRTPSSQLLPNLRHHLPASFWPAVERHEPFHVIGGEAMEPSRRSLIQLKLYELRFPYLQEALFPSASTVPWLESVAQTAFTGDPSRLRHCFAFLHAHQLLETHLQCAYVAFEFLQSPKAAVKLAKSLLSQNPTTLTLWNAYGQLEWARRKWDEARKVWVQSLAHFGTHDDAPALWATWARCEMERDLGMAARVLVARTQSGGELLGVKDLLLDADNVDLAKQWYRSHLGSRLTMDDVHDIESSLMLHYATNDMDGLCLTAEDLLRRADPAAVVTEYIYMFYAKLLYFHSATRTSYKPDTLRKVLERALSHFPENSIFLHLYLLNESRTRIQNRARNLLETKLAASPQAESLWLFRIYVELHIDPTRGASREAVSYIFERAVAALETPSLRLWVAYLDFAAREDPKLAKSVLLRAVQQCPWAKELYIPAFRTTRSAFRPMELDEVYNTMREREIRLHVDLSPFSQIEMLNFGTADVSEDDEME